MSLKYVLIVVVLYLCWAECTCVNVVIVSRLIAVIGPVGAGKSSLLHVLLRELPLQSGSVHIGGTVSYASQEPWLFAGQTHVSENVNNLFLY